MSNKDTVHRLLGSGNKENREYGDFYPTPIRATKELLKVEKFDGIIWECACGNGAISKVIEKENIKVISSDILDYGYGETNIDFLNDTNLFNKFDFKADNIITNPPFKKIVAATINKNKCLPVGRRRGIRDGHSAKPQRG